MHMEIISTPKHLKIKPKTPKSEIEIAESRKRDYFQRKRGTKNE